MAEESKAQSLTIAEFDEVIEKAWQLRQELDELDAQKKARNEALTKLNETIVFHMKENEKTSYNGKHCQIIVKNNFGVKIPKGDDKFKFFEHLKETNEFEALATVHHATLNSWYNEKLEAAKASGTFDFRIPGLSMPTLFQSLSYRKL